jgi:hypothetical protein
MVRAFVFSILIATCMVICWSCNYSRGEKYRSLIAGDSLNYLILAKGKGYKISEKMARLKYKHEVRGNSCQVRYLTDSVLLRDQKALLLVYTDMPDIENDLLTKGFIGTFSSRQEVTYIIVSRQEFENYFRRMEE